MLSPALFQTSRYALPAVKSLGARQLSTEAILHRKLVARPPNIIHDYLSPTPSHLLNVSLSGFLPKLCYPPNFKGTNLEPKDLPAFPDGAVPDGFKVDSSMVLPQGHHLVYFSPQVPTRELLPDGTDLLQSPGEPFVRRLWAGGSLRYNLERRTQLPLDGRCAASCEERITDVFFKGMETKGNGKVFVNIERRIGIGLTRSEGLGIGDFGDILKNSKHRGYDGSPKPEPSIVETRTLVFMKEISEASAKEDATKPDRVIKAPHEPDFSVSLIPTKSLLFRFSALTFNAHAIHLDPQYAREVEGHRGLLVHGPLSLVLMLSVLRSQLRGGRVIKRFDYKNLAPLYVNEEMKICVLRNIVSDPRTGMSEEKYNVWIEGKQGGYAVRGTATVGNYQEDPDDMR